MATVLCLVSDLRFVAVGVAVAQYVIGNTSRTKLLRLAGVNQLLVMALAVFAASQYQAFARLSLIRAYTPTFVYTYS